MLIGALIIGLLAVTDAKLQADENPPTMEQTEAPQDGVTERGLQPDPGLKQGSAGQPNQLKKIIAPEVIGPPQISAGWTGTCQSSNVGDVTCWDGDGPPYAMKGVSTAKGVSAGVGFEHYHCAILSIGQVVCSSGSRGNPFGGPQSDAVIQGVKNAVTMDLEYGYACILMTPGDVVCTTPGVGALSGSVNPILSGATAIATGTDHACAVVQKGRVYCWGYQTGGQLGPLGNMTGPTPKPVEVPMKLAARSIAAGRLHTCALMEDGTVWCWGFVPVTGPSGTTQLSLDPIPLVGPRSKAIAVAAGGWHTCVLLDSGAVQCWGGGGTGQQPRLIPLKKRARTISAGLVHACVMLEDDTPICWGYAPPNTPYPMGPNWMVVQ